MPFLHLAWGYFTAISRIVAFDNLFHANGEDYLMSRILIMCLVALFSVSSLTACGAVGKGKGKAPPPVAEAPITK
ncbi:hypothetical protein BN77_0416 [Rhizobium mesoamericanum STM3625]|uniref:Transmembrane protein n=2 Tax=Rhizobium TaxID=379 RepID=K0PLX0_9HYPH|nr:hypothetical protein BN77_0416 [Rhizobium mesoamericanum STM3625]